MVSRRAQQPASRLPRRRRSPGSAALSVAHHTPPPRPAPRPPPSPPWRRPGALPPPPHPHHPPASPPPTCTSSWWTTTACRAWSSRPCSKSVATQVRTGEGGGRGGNGGAGGGEGPGRARRATRPACLRPTARRTPLSPAVTECESGLQAIDRLRSAPAGTFGLVLTVRERGGEGREGDSRSARPTSFLSLPPLPLAFLGRHDARRRRHRAPAPRAGGAEPARGAGRQ